MAVGYGTNADVFINGNRTPATSVEMTQLPPKELYGKQYEIRIDSPEMRRQDIRASVAEAKLKAILEFAMRRAGIADDAEALDKIRDIITHTPGEE